jgi:hypothetical protein
LVEHAVWVARRMDVRHACRRWSSHSTRRELPANDDESVRGERTFDDEAPIDGVARDDVGRAATRDAPTGSRARQRALTEATHVVA